MKNTKKRMVRCRNIIIAALLALTVLVLGASTFLFDYAIVRKDALSNAVSPKRDPIANVMAQSRIDGRAWMDERNMEKMQITALDGVILTGYFLASHENNQKVAVLLHGHRSNMSMMGNYARFYEAQGFSIFMADARGHGESGGKYLGMGWLDRLDYLLWLDSLVKKAGANCQIVLHGVSMGASAAMMLSGEEGLPTQVKCVIADCGYTSVSDEFCHQITHLFHLPSFPLLNLGDLECRLLAGFSFEEASALAQVKKTKLPLLLIHGDADIYNPTEMAYALYDAAAGETELWIVPGAAHGMAFYVMPEEYIRRCEDFYQNYVH